jgi:nucleoside-diphosphate-sugar epimerase
MKVLVIGGTGLIGSYAVKELIERGHSVRILCRTPATSCATDVTEFVQGDYLLGLPPSAFDGVEGLVHAAGTDYRIFPKEDAGAFFHRTNVIASAKVFADARQAGVKRGVFISSFYHANWPQYCEHPYIASRRDSEEAVIQASAGELSVSIIQPAWVLGITQGHLNLGGFLAQWAYSKMPMLINRGGTNWVSGTSLGHAMATALEGGEHGERYCIGDENRSWVGVAQQLVDGLGVHKRVHVAPRAGTLLTGALGSLALTLANRHSGLYPYAWSRVLMGNTYFDPAPAVQALGYPVNRIDEALTAMANHWRREPVMQPSSAALGGR